MLYVFFIGVLLGLLQNGLFFQLSFTLSSSFTTYLLVTVCWLAGGALGAAIIARTKLPLWFLLIVMLIAYAAVALMLLALPFDTRLWLVYAALIAAAGVYPGVFFARLTQHYPVGGLFFWENNGFLLGMVGGTLLFIVAGRPALWIAPAVFAVLALLLKPRDAR
jgi:hypothetical protein